jgi:hypothetical protein
MQQKSEPKKPGIRIDGGERRDLNKDRVAGRMTALAKDAPTPEQTAARRTAMEKRAQAERKAAKIGNEGAKAYRIKVRDLQGQHARTLTQTIRCRPGTFEWRYGRNKQDALFYAGSYLAQLWERAGMTIASSANFLRGITSGYATGLANGRVQAIDTLDGFREVMGQKPAERLIDYCVLGLTTAEIARKDGTKERDMAPVLHQHLRDCARHFHFMGGKR